MTSILSQSLQLHCDSSLLCYLELQSPKKYNLRIYCGLNLMMDESIANLTCLLEKYGLSDNTILVISGDNGYTSELA